MPGVISTLAEVAFSFCGLSGNGLFLERESPLSAKGKSSPPPLLHSKKKEVFAWSEGNCRAPLCSS